MNTANSTVNNSVDLLARIGLGHIFLLAGISKISGYAGTAAYMESAGVPGALLPLVIALEIGGGLALIVGFLTRWAALGLALFSLGAAVIFHADIGDSMQKILFMKNLAIAGGLLLLFLHGAQRYSLDARRA